jgi:hypothetical protein
MLPIWKNCTICSESFLAEYARATSELDWMTSELCFGCEFKLRANAKPAPPTPTPPEE